MNKQLSVLVRKPRESMPLIETESSTPALSKTKAPGKTESAVLANVLNFNYVRYV